MCRPLPLLLLLLAVLAATVKVSRGASLDTSHHHHLTRRQATPRGSDISRQCLRCICEARRCDWSPACRGGACGGYQISEPYFNHSNVTRDVPLYADRTHESCTTDPKCAITVVKLYMRTLATDCNEDGEIDCTDMMMTHYYGLHGCVGAQAWVEFSDTYRLYSNCMSNAKN